MKTAALVGAMSVAAGMLASGCVQQDLEESWGLSERRVYVADPAKLPARDARSGEFQVFVPVGVERGRIALSAIEAMTIGNGAEIREVTPRGEPQRYGTLVSLGSSSIAAAAKVGSLYAFGGSPVRVESGASLRGYLRSRFPLSGAEVAFGQLLRDENPVVEFWWTVSFEPTALGQRSIRLEDGVSPLAPGRYDQIVVDEGGQALLRAGEYRLNSLAVRPKGTLRIDNSIGAVYVWVKDTLDLSGLIVEYYVAPNVLFGLASANPPLLGGQFRGTLVAPSAEIRVPALDEPHKGSFYGRSIVVEAGAKVDFRMYMGWPLPPDAQKICEECSRRAAVDARTCCDEFKNQSQGEPFDSARHGSDRSREAAARQGLDDCQRDIPEKFSRCLLRSNYRPEACEALQLPVSAPLACVAPSSGPSEAP